MYSSVDAFITSAPVFNVQERMSSFATSIREVKLLACIVFIRNQGYSVTELRASWVLLQRLRNITSVQWWCHHVHTHPYELLQSCVVRTGEGIPWKR